MPVLKIEVSLDSDALVTDPSGEVSRMLSQALRVLEEPAWSSVNIRDSNDNTVGSCWLEED